MFGIAPTETQDGQLFVVNKDTNTLMLQYPTKAQLIALLCLPPECKFHVKRFFFLTFFLAPLRDLMGYDKFIADFLTSFLSFITPLELLQELIKRYTKIPPFSEKLPNLRPSPKNCPTSALLRTPPALLRKN